MLRILTHNTIKFSAYYIVTRHFTRNKIDKKLKSFAELKSKAKMNKTKSMERNEKILKFPKVCLTLVAGAVAGAATYAANDINVYEQYFKEHYLSMKKKVHWFDDDHDDKDELDAKDKQSFAASKVIILQNFAQQLLAGAEDAISPICCKMEPFMQELLEKFNKTPYFDSNRIFFMNLRQNALTENAEHQDKKSEETHGAATRTIDIEKKK